MTEEYDYYAVNENGDMVPWNQSSSSSSDVPSYESTQRKKPKREDGFYKNIGKKGLTTRMFNSSMKKIKALSSQLESSQDHIIAHMLKSNDTNLLQLLKGIGERTASIEKSMKERSISGDVSEQKQSEPTISADVGNSANQEKQPTMDTSEDNIPTAPTKAPPAVPEKGMMPREKEAAHVDQARELAKMREAMAEMRQQMLAMRQPQNSAPSTESVTKSNPSAQQQQQQQQLSQNQQRLKPKKKTTRVVEDDDDDEGGERPTKVGKKAFVTNQGRPAMTRPGNPAYAQRTQRAGVAQSHAVLMAQRLRAQRQRARQQLPAPPTERRGGLYGF